MFVVVCLGRVKHSALSVSPESKYYVPRRGFNYFRDPFTMKQSKFSVYLCISSRHLRQDSRPPFPKQWSAVQRPEAWPSVEVIGECDDIERAEQLVACALLDSDSPQVVDVLRVSKQAETPSCRTGGHRVFRQS